MKRFLILAIMVLVLLVPISVMAVSPVVTPAAGYTAAVQLEDKDPSTWAIIGLGTGKTATLSYIPSGATFSFKLEASGLEVSIPYSLIYYANPYPGNNPGALIVTGTSSAGGLLTITAAPNLNKNLPTPPDANLLIDHSVAPDFYSHAYGAKVWLVPSDCYVGGLISTYSPTRFLFETDMLNYTDTDLPVVTTLPTTATITEPTSIIGLTVSPASLSFGSVAIGSCSAVVPITLNNTGNVPIKVTANPSVGINTSCMQLQPTGGAYTAALGWVSPTILAGQSLIVNAKLCPTAAFSGTVPGTLGFNASFAP
jgi:hypothetical protein